MGITLTPGTWEETESWIGKLISTMVGPDEVDKATIRRKLEVLNFDCPLHTDEAVAREHGYRTIVAPATMMATWALPAYWSPGQPPVGSRTLMPLFPLSQVPAPGNAIIGSEVQSEYFEPVYVGDRISCENRLVSIAHRCTRLGMGAFLTIESTYTKQTGELVCVERFVSFRYSVDEHEEEVRESA